jgi:hypothetical protein
MAVRHMREIPPGKILPAALSAKAHRSRPAFGINRLMAGRVG